MVEQVTPFEALHWSVENCTISRAMAILGEKWTIVVLREVFSGLRRFDDMRVRTGIPRQVLTNRLALLVEHGVLRRVPYREPGTRVRHEYRLTEKGFDLYPVLIAVAEWGNRYLADPDRSPYDRPHMVRRMLIELRELMDFVAWPIVRVVAHLRT